MAERDTEAMMPMTTSGAPLPWWAEGVCREGIIDADSWFPDPRTAPEAKVAKKICMTMCPVREACNAEAMANPGTRGIWGGLDELDRRRAHRRLARYTNA